MTFAESVRYNLTSGYLFDFKGRASRSQFWWFTFFIFIINIIASALSLALPKSAALGFSLCVSLLLLPPNLGVTVRRFHDRNLRGWWLLLPVLALGVWALAGGGHSANLAGDLLSFLMCLAYLIILCLPGQPGPNRFGPPPGDARIGLF